MLDAIRGVGSVGNLSESPLADPGLLGAASARLAQSATRAVTHPADPRPRMSMMLAELMNGRGGHAKTHHAKPDPGHEAVKLARKFEGRNAIDVRGHLKNYSAAGGQTNDCADFVSAVLQDTHQIKGHDINVNNLESRLESQGWHRVSAENSKPGNVWISSSRGHTQLVTNYNGTRSIGANNDYPGHEKIHEEGLDASSGVYYAPPRRHA